MNNFLTTCLRKALKTTSMMLVLFSCLAFLSVSVHALTVGNLTDRARIYLRDTSSDTGRQRFSDAQILAWLNDGQRLMNVLAQVQKSSYSLTTVSGVQEYPLPSDFQATWRVTHRGRKIDQTSFNQLDAESSAWESASGFVQKYYIYEDTTTIIGFYPEPVASSTGTAVVYYISQVTDMSSSSDVPFSGWVPAKPYHEALALYAAYRGLWSIGDINMADRYLAEYQSMVEAARTGLMSKPDYNPPFSSRRE